MYIALTDAEKQLTELVRRAQAGEEIVLTLAGAPVAKLEGVSPRAASEKLPDQSMEERRAAIQAIRAKARLLRNDGPSREEIDAEMYDEFGLPR